MIIFFIPNVYAAEYNMNSHTSASLNGTKNRYLGTEIYNTGTSNTYTFGTRYNGKLSAIDAYFDYPFEQGTTYRLTYNMNTEDFRNNFGGKYWWDCSQTMNATNQHLGTFTYVSYKKVQFTFTPAENTTCIRVLLGSTNLSSTAITGVSNWRLDSITLYDPDYQSGSGSGQGSTSPTPSPTPSGASNQDIINNQTNNTNNIINNNNENANNIIENNNENTNKIIDNQNKNTDSTNALLGSCHKNIFDISNFEPYVNGRYSKSERFSEYAIVLTATGNYTGGSFPLIYHLQLIPDTTYYFKKGDSIAYTGNLYYYLYRGSASGTLVAYTNSNDNFSFTTSNTNYVDYYLQVYVTGSQEVGGRVVLQRPMLFEGSDYSGSYIPYGEEKCTSKLDETTNAINELDDTIKDDNVDDKGSFFTDFQDNDHGLTSIITLPLSTIQSLTNTSCVALSVPIPFTNESVSLPCMSEVYQTYVPSIYNIWQIVSFGIISYFICLDIYKMVKGFKDPNEDKVEVLDL